MDTMDGKGDLEMKIGARSSRGFILSTLLELDCLQEVLLRRMWKIRLQVRSNPRVQNARVVELIRRQESLCARSL